MVNNKNLQEEVDIKSGVKSIIDQHYKGEWEEVDFDTLINDIDECVNANGDNNE